MVAPIVLLVSALATSAAAAILPWLQREETDGLSWERKTAFGILLADAAYHWWSFAHLGSESRDPTWLATLILLLAAGAIFSFYLAARGYALPEFVRWTMVAAVGVVEPVVLVVSFLAVHGPVPLL